KAEFRLCDGYPEGAFDVNMNPDPVKLGENVTFDIFATVTDDVLDDGKIIVDFLDEDSFILLSQPFDLPPGIKANQTIDDIISMPVKLSSLPKTYYIHIGIYSHTADAPFLDVACTRAFIVTQEPL
ncbi:8031_t:CDS:1, partial [Racocetra fulgida]